LVFFDFFPADERSLIAKSSIPAAFCWRNLGFRSHSRPTHLVGAWSKIFATSQKAFDFAIRLLYDLASLFLPHFLQMMAWSQQIADTSDRPYSIAIQ
jgi:hypothetical protein